MPKTYLSFAIKVILKKPNLFFCLYILLKVVLIRGINVKKEEYNV